MAEEPTTPGHIWVETSVPAARGHIWMETPGPCWHCEALTHWIDIAFEVPLCPGPCTAAKTREYTDAGSGLA